MEQETKFYQLLDDHIATISECRRNKFVISEEVYNAALDALSLSKGSKCPRGSGFKFWSNKHFTTQTIGKPCLEMYS